ncbi:MAG: Uma2 family endonuclease [Chloroflexales bacterium]|nr:Uma2 family endonuclease [Chloroflexales bacterium]
MRTLVVAIDAPTVPGPPQGHWTYADWEALPDDGRIYELIDGVLYMTTAPSNYHQWITMSLVQHLGIPAKTQGLGYAFTAPIGLLLPGGDAVQPDFVFVRQANAGIIRDRRIRGVPDLIIEILSPSSVVYDTQVKLLTYATAIVPEYGIIDPCTRTLDYYRLHAPGRYDGARTFSEADSVSFACLPTVTLRVADLFTGAPDTTL